MILIYIFAAVAAINCAYYFLFSKFITLKPAVEINAASFPVSVIVCAKNEEENLKTLLPKLLSQKYTNFEIILINDCSTDNTLQVIEDFAESHDRIKIVNVKPNEAFYGNKKYALTLGIKKAIYTRLIFTDADCVPASDQWLSIMVSYFSQEKQLILGYGGYFKKSGFLNKLIRFETTMTAVQYFSYATIGKPYMGVGRNLGYTSTLFYDNNGFMNHIKVLSGDDDLFVNQVATSKNTALCINPKAFTFSTAKASFNDWQIQKRRHISTSKLYKRDHKLWLGLYYATNLLFWILFILNLVLFSWKLALLLFSIRLLFQYMIIGKALKKLNENDLIPFIAILELFLIFFQLRIFMVSRNPERQRWK